MQIFIKIWVSKGSDSLMQEVKFPYRKTHILDNLCCLHREVLRHVYDDLNVTVTWLSGLHSPYAIN